MGQRERNRCRERLEALAGAGLDAEQARHAAIRELRRAVGFERWCWPLTDPVSGLSVSGIGEFDFWPSLARMVALEQRGDIASKAQLVTSAETSMTLSGVTGGDLARSRRWRECLAPYGIGDQLMTACRDRHGCWGSVELMRDSGDASFDQDDSRLLHELAPVLGTLLRRGLHAGGHLAAGSADPQPPATLILGPDLHPKGWTPSLRARLRELPPAGIDPDMLPTAIYEIAARSRGSGVAGELPNRVRIRTPAGRWSVIEGAPLEGDRASEVVITLRDATPDEVYDLLCRAHDLTPRERQLVALIRAGLSTTQLAHALHISAYTVKDHLKAIFNKTGVRSRRELVSYLAGGTAPAAEVRR